MLKPNLTLIGGMGSGKTHLADHLVAAHGYTKLSLATPVKEEAARRLGRPIDKGIDRPFLQQVGAEGRAIHPDHWTHALVSKLADDQTMSAPWVVDDCRFENEAAILKAHGFRVVLVETAIAVCVRRVTERDGAFDPKWLNDPSEQGWKTIPADFAIDGTASTGWEAEKLLWFLGPKQEAA